MSFLIGFRRGRIQAIVFAFQVEELQQLTLISHLLSLLFLFAGVDVHIQPPSPSAAAVLVCEYPVPWLPSAPVTLQRKWQQAGEPFHWPFIFFEAPFLAA